MAVNASSGADSTIALKLTVNRSPATLAERLADVFLTTQFGLALLIASVVYYWRFHSGTVTFGSSSVHYIQAFILGFAAYAAVADLPKALVELALK
jgi:biopolymer transport protein ExbB/TolQ